MTFKEFKNTEEYLLAIVLEVYSDETGLEFDDDFPEKELEKMEVVSFSAQSGWLSVALQI